MTSKSPYVKNTEIKTYFICFFALEQLYKTSFSCIKIATVANPLKKGKEYEGMDILRGYVEAVKRNMETMNASDYDGKEEDLRRQQEELERYEQRLKEKSASADRFDQVVDAAVDCAAGDISFSQLEHMYQQEGS
ncbi:hypothetical protein DI291_11365 [Bacillus paralicheniformis]|nr:hypothetical protein EI979_15470 [Bacillus paralicheniformis]KAA0843197.1 hypothetical protein EI977_00295 [Bacillus paralicheniformis]QSF98976.1 hypothetical protein DI291_11365 [Bacillus paralicheniformis]UAY71687.1 YnfE family protein [Bacillus paralicheniformis]